ncbi:MAG TPA: class I tRNA ligase family protein, partial [Mycobacterium sp.]|nr:class I tRNA ligase family protein [Mycobacterium sp.]
MTESPPAVPGCNAAATAADVDAPQYRYTAELAGRIERTWQGIWARHGTFNAANPVGSLAPEDGSAVPDDKLFVQDMFPYPSGDGLHVGHPLGYIATDVYARYFRMIGRNVLHALGFDAFGLPAEQYAVQTGTHPRARTEANTVTFRRQLGRLGFGHDTRRSFSTTDVEFYKWTQWIFLQIYNAWFDVAANKARPITELIAEFESGTRTLDDSQDWTTMSAGE